MCCSTSRVTRYLPYFVLYSQWPFFAFDFADTLNWHKVASTEDLLAICMQQILHHNKKLVLAMEEQKHTCQQAVDDFNHKHEKYLSSGDFILRTWILLHEMWLDSHMGNKGCWDGQALTSFITNFIIQHISCKSWMGQSFEVLLLLIIWRNFIIARNTRWFGQLTRLNMPFTSQLLLLLFMHLYSSAPSTNLLSWPHPTLFPSNLTKETWCFWPLKGLVSVHFQTKI